MDLHFPLISTTFNKDSVSTHLLEKREIQVSILNREWKVGHEAIPTVENVDTPEHMLHPIRMSRPCIIYCWIIKLVKLQLQSVVGELALDDLERFGVDLCVPRHRADGRASHPHDPNPSTHAGWGGSANVTRDWKACVPGGLEPELVSRAVDGAATVRLSGARPSEASETDRAERRRA